MVGEAAALQVVAVVVVRAGPRTHRPEHVRPQQRGQRGQQEDAGDGAGAAEQEGRVRLQGGGAADGAGPAPLENVVEVHDGRGTAGGALAGLA